MQISDLIEKAKKVAGIPTDKELTIRLGVSHGAVHHWKVGRSLPKPEQLMHLAELAGEDPAPLIAELLQEGAKDSRLKAVYARIKTAVMAAAVCILCKIHAVPPTAPLTAPPQPSRGSTWRLRHPITGKTGTSKGNFFAHRTVTGLHRNASSPAYS